MSEQKQLKEYHIGLHVDFDINAETKKEAMEMAYERIREIGFTSAGTEYVSVSSNGERKRLSKDMEWEW